MTKIQIFIVHWGMTFKTHTDYVDWLKTRKIKLETKISWRDAYLAKELWDVCQIIKPRMPLQDNAKYSEWKIHFERYFDQFNDNIVLIWSSLWWIFLAKYLSENKFPKKILSSYIICPPYDNTLEDEDLVGWFELGHDLSLLQENSPNNTFMFSGDDPVIPLSHADKYKSKIPDSKYIIYESKNWHFRVPEFPEIVEMMKSDLKNI